MSRAGGVSVCLGLQCNILFQQMYYSGNENNYEKIFLSFIHCPDTIEQYKQDFLFFKDSIMKKGKLDEKDIKTMKAYQTFLI